MKILSKVNEIIPVKYYIAQCLAQNNCSKHVGCCLHHPPKCMELLPSWTPVYFCMCVSQDIFTSI